ncbi:hypothetical protein [Paenibacillus illinoisensis]|uniref:hypothetical protein n=1 Tax=Paenibacillus illinoisensis TaxID=59845 RepID=UPI0020419113|nr:hypothetical protein [Paenibacillus illinoisensis]MCM3204419.1 hypothetical protein [Paenibacillus illinoisensis]
MPLIDNYLLDNYLLDGPSGLKYATGNLLSNAGGLSFTTTSNQAASYSYITVAGLIFLPSVIVITDVSTGAWVGTYSAKTAQSSSGAYYFMAANQAQLKITGNAYINSTGFQLPANVASRNYEWEAFGSDI